MTEEEFHSVVLPRASVSIPEQEITGIVEFKFEQDGSKCWHLWGSFPYGDTNYNSSILLEQEEIVDILEEVLPIDNYCQTEDFRDKLKELAQRAVASAIRAHKKGKSPECKVELEPYILQQHAVVPVGEALFMKLAPIMSETKRVPDEFKIHAPKNFLPDEIAHESLLQRIYEGVPAIAIIGPTGSGKSALARYVGSELILQNWGTYVIDASARLGGDRLFERDDFDPSGTFLLEGFLLKAVRKAKEAGIKLLVIIEEYNTLSDETRREFYRIFTCEDRVYHVQSPQPIHTDDGKILHSIDFSHTCFVLTMNPVQERYLTDDVKRLSNAETRRLTMIYLDYERKQERIEKILRMIVESKLIYQTLMREIPDLSEKISYKLGADIFLALADRKDPLGYDVGYSSVADVLWTAALRSHRKDRYSIALSEHILNAIPDPQTRELAAKRIQQATGIALRSVK